MVEGTTAGHSCGTGVALIYLEQRWEQRRWPWRKGLARLAVAQPRASKARRLCVTGRRHVRNVISQLQRNQEHVAPMMD